MKCTQIWESETIILHPLIGMHTFSCGYDLFLLDALVTGTLFGYLGNGQVFNILFVTVRNGCVAVTLSASGGETWMECTLIDEMAVDILNANNVRCVQDTRVEVRSQRLIGVPWAELSTPGSATIQ
jgi:hypothetical protein